MPKNQHHHQQQSSSIDSESADNSTSEDESKTLEIKSSISTNYEKQREATIAANKARIEALGLKNMANSLINCGKVANSTPKSKESVKKKKKKDAADDDEYEPDCDYDDDDDDDDGGRLSESSDDEDYEEEEEETFVRRNRKLSGKKVKNMKLQSDKQVSVSNLADIAAFMDEDEALKQAIALSLKDVGEISDSQHGRSSQSSKTRTASSKEKSRDQTREDNAKRKKQKLFTSRVQMTEDDLVIHFCQIDEVGKGAITLRDVERMAATHDFAWTDKELSDMIRCFDSDRDGKLTLDDLRNIVQRCNMLQAQEDF
ncbi:hypothetical protein vseg_009242 [Gypsophila vaccaria]